MPPPVKKPIPAKGIVPQKDTLLPPMVRILDTAIRPLVVQSSLTGARYSYHADKFSIASPVVKPAGFRANITNYSADDGLYGMVSCMYEDRTGHMWFGTEGAGVIRYDGKTFTTYTKSQGLSSDNILSIDEDKWGNMRFGSMGGGICIYDGKTFTSYPTSKFNVTSFDNNAVSAMLTDANSDTWYGTYGGGAVRMNGNTTKVFTHANGLGLPCSGDCLGNDIILDILEDKKGSLWFCLGGGGVSHYNGKTFTNYSKNDGLADNIVRCAISDHNGDIWFGTASGLSRYDGRTFSTYNIDSGTLKYSITSLIEDDRGNIWVGTNGGGVSRYDGKMFSRFTTDNGLASNKISSIVQDRSGSIWFGTSGGGATRYDGEAFVTFTSEEGLPGSNLTGITRNAAGDIWLGTAGNGVCRYNGNTFTTYSTNQGLPFGFVECVKADNANNIWIGTGGTGVTRFDGLTMTTYDDAQLLNNRTVYSVLEDRRGRKWFATFNGVTCLDGNKATFFSKANGLCSTYIVCMAEDSKGGIWFGSMGGGVSRYDGNVFTNYSAEQGLASNVVPCILADKGGNIWLGSDGAGVTRYDGNSFITFTVADGLPSNYISAMAESNDGIIWLGTHDGLCGVTGFKNNDRNNKTKDLIPACSAISNQSICNGDAPVFENYSLKNGYPVRNINLRSMYVDTGGVLWTATGDMLIRFNRKAIHHNRAADQVFIKALKISDKSIAWYTLQNHHENNTTDSLAILNEETGTYGSILPRNIRDTLLKEFEGVHFDSIGRFYPIPYGLTLPYRHNNITIDFGAIDLPRSYLVKYQYILEGYDESWSPVTDKASVSFGNIHEGHYAFKLRALSPDGVWSEQLVYEFTVLPPFYRTWWAICVYGLLAALTIYALLRWRTLNLTREKVQLEMVVKERTADVVREKNEVEKQKKVADELLAQKDILMKEIHHRVKNNLQVIISLLDLQRDTLADEAAQKAIAVGIGRVKSIALIHKQLYQADGVAGIELPRFTADLIAQVSAVFRKPGQEISINNSIADKMLDIDTAIPLGLILNELMTNSYKYAFDNNNGSISINIAENKGQYTLVYKDSGPGLPAGFDVSRSTTLGQVIITSLSQQLGGRYVYDKDNKEFIIEFLDEKEHKKHHTA